MQKMLTVLLKLDPPELKVWAQMFAFGLSLSARRLAQKCSLRPLNERIRPGARVIGPFIVDQCCTFPPPALARLEPTPAVVTKHKQSISIGLYITGATAGRLCSYGFGLT